MRTTTSTEVAAGGLLLAAQRVGGHTRLTALTCRPPLQVLRAHHLDPALPEMAFVTVLSPSGGVLQGDRLSLAVDAGPRTQLHLDTPSATRLYRMPAGGARQQTRISVGEGAFVELLPEPYLPYAGSRFDHEGTFEVAESGTLIVGEVVAPGRQARGEELDYARFASRLEVRRPDGALVCRDVCRLEPEGGLRRPGLLTGHVAVGTLLVVARNLTPDVLAGATGGPGWAGCSELPEASGAWLRVLAPDSATAASLVAAGWRAARVALTGAAPPPVRRY